MKRILITLLISVLMLAGLSSCHFIPKVPDGPEDEKPTVSWEDFNLTVSVSEDGILTWNFKGQIQVEGNVGIELFRGGELGLNPKTPVDKVMDSYGLEHVDTEHVSVIEGCLDLGSRGLWEELPGGIYTVFIRIDTPEIEGGIFTYVYCFEKPEVTEFTVRFIDGRDGGLIRELKLPVGEALTPDMYPALPPSGVGYTVAWSQNEAFVPERNVEIVALYDYTRYAINYVYDEEIFEKAYEGHDFYTLMPDKDGTPWEYSLHTMFSEEKKFLGWSTEEGGEPMRVLLPDYENPDDITLYLVWEEYTAEELEFYRLFRNTLGLSKYTLTDIERDRLIAVDKAAGYAHKSNSYSDENECYTEIWHGGYYYHVRDKYYCEKEFAEELRELTVMGLAQNFPRMNCVTNISKTAGGYEFDIVFANESYHLTVKSNGNYFTAISGDYNKSYINATLTNTAERLDIPTDFEFRVFPRTTVANVDTDEFIFDTDTSYMSYEMFLEQFDGDFRSYNYQDEYIYIGIFTDEACTAPLTEDYYEKNKDGRLNLYTRLHDKESYIESLTVTVNIYIDYHLMPSGKSGKALMDTLTLPVLELPTLWDYCKKYEGWGEYGHVLLEGNLVLYDSDCLILKEGYSHLDYINDTDFLQWLKNELTKPVDGDYTIEVRINVDSDDPCRITIDGYGSFYDSHYFSPGNWLIELDGMVPSGYYFDAELTDPVPSGWTFESEITLYCSWVKGEIVSFTVCDINGFSATIDTTTATELYDALSGYWCSRFPLFYDEKCTEFVNYDVQIKGGETYFVDSRMEKVSFTVVCNGKTYEIEGYENTSLDFNRFFWKYPYDDIERDLRDQDLYPDFSEAAMSALIKEGGTYEIEAKEVPKYYIYLGEELLTSGYINGYAMESFEARLGELISRYSTTRTYGKIYSTSGTFKGYTDYHSVTSYLTADLSTLLPYEYCGDPTESLYLYLVGDFFQVNINVANEDGTFTEGSYLLSSEDGQEFTLQEFLGYVTDFNPYGGHVIYKNGQRVADIYTEIMTAGTYESKYEPKITVSVSLKDENSEYSYYDYTAPAGITVREFFDSVMCLDGWENYYIYTDFSSTEPISNFDSVIDGYGHFTVKYHLEIYVSGSFETNYGYYDSFYHYVIKGTTVREFLDDILPHDKAWVSYDWADYNIYLNGVNVNGALDNALEEGFLRIEKKDVYVSVYLENEAGEFTSSSYTAPKGTTLGAFLKNVMRLENYQSYYIYYQHCDIEGNFSIVMDEGRYEYYIARNQKVFIGVSSREYINNIQYLWEGDLFIVNKGTTVKDAVSKFLGLEGLDGHYVYTYGPEDDKYSDITGSCGTAAKDGFNYVVSDQPLICLTMTMPDDQPYGFELFRKGSTVRDIMNFMYGEVYGSWYKVYMNGTLVEDYDTPIEWGSLEVSYN